MSASFPDCLIDALSRRGLIAASQGTHKLQEIIDASPVMVSVLDKENRYLYVNRAWERTFGRSDRQATGHSVFELFPEPVAAEIAELNRRALVTGAAVQSELTFRNGGQVRTLVTTRMLLVNQAAEREAVWETSLEVTERASASKRLSLLSDIATSLLLRGNDVDGFIAEMYGRLATELEVDVFFLYRTTTTDARLRLAHHGGVSSDIARSVEWLDFGQVVCGNVAATRHAQVIDDVQHCQDAKTELIRELGIVAYACFPLVAQGVLHGTFSLGRRRGRAFAPPDVELMQTLADLVSVAFDREARARALLEADQHKDNFLAVLAHELRAPLGPVSSAVAMLQLGGGDPDRVGHARAIIERQVRKLAQLVNQLTDLAQVRRGQMMLNARMESVGDIIADGIELSRSNIDARGHILTISLPPDPVHVYADRDRLAQVIANLLSNSAKYTPDNGHIALEIAVEHATVVIRVRDDGIGIAADVLPQIFDLFAQAADARARDKSGMGIGLALVRSLVELHDGSIEAHSPGPGLGSEFIIRLPKQNEPAG